LSDYGVFQDRPGKCILPQTQNPKDAP
jgi:hypothetical protein